MRSYLLALALLAVGCHATSYHALDEHGFGYCHAPLQEDLVRVSFYGNALTTAERASDLCLLRAAELALEGGYSHFVIFDDWVESTVSSDANPEHRATHVVKMLSEAPSLDAFAVDFFQRATCRRYGLGASLQEFRERQRSAEAARLEEAARSAEARRRNGEARKAERKRERQLGG